MTRQYALFLWFKERKVARSCLALLAMAVLLLKVAPAYATTCANAIVINPASLPITNQALVCGAGNDMSLTSVPGTLCGTGDNGSYKNGNEALYRFTPTTTGAYQLSYVGQTWCAAMVYIGCPTLNNCLYGDGNTGNSVGFSVNLTAGIEYFIWFDTWPSPNSPCPGTFSFGPPPPPITNDNPCQATSLTVNPNLLCGTQTPGSLVGATATATVPTAPCFGTPNDDVWFAFTATGPTHYINLNNVVGNTTDLYHAVYSGNCNSLTNISCSDPNNSIVTGLIGGNTYWVRVYSYYGNAGANTTFSVCIGTPPPPPANDNPCGAVGLTVNPTLVCTSQTPGSLASATQTTSVPSAPCGGTPNDDVWFQFTATGPTHHIDLNNVAGSTTDLFHAVYSGTNCNSLSNVSCSDPNNSIVTGLIGGNTYWVRVYSWSSTTGANSTFDVCIGTPPPPPPPPACGGIFYDNGGPTGNYQANSNETTTICPSTPGDMVSLIFTQFDLETNYDQLRIYDGNSTAGALLGTFTGTALPPVLTASNPSGCLTAVFTSDGSGQYAGWAAQVLCGPMPAGDCVYALHLHDSGGNGWGSSFVGVRINGGPYTYHTVTASDNIIFIGVNIGDLIELNYIATGPNQGQNSYSISKLGQNPYFTSTTPPAPGIIFSQIVACAPPPAPPQDCIGGITVCSSQAITNNSSSTGDVMDLNSSNQGCLSSGERQGTWYYFSPQTNGTIAFSITPANGTDDYDFAVWGPYPNAQCPTGPPLRCSYDAPGPYTTGLNATATQTTEGAAGTGWVRDISAQADEVYVLYIDNFSTTGQAFTLNWQLTNTSLDCTTLPVELIELNADARDPVIDVSWATATEQNSLHFTVERSPDNETFTPIGTVPAAGNAQFRNDYLFVDENPFRGVNYYRLEQVDIDGTTMRSHTVVATLSDGDGRPSIYPNPASDVLNVVFPHPLDTPVELQVQDALGRTVAMAPISLVSGQRTAQVPIEQLAKGWYNLRIAGPEGQVVNGGGFLKK
ncbi:MAG: T9SS type A sorting domain-containing protein [Flavobacteriales bacterium]|nr:T9SS type A sorting domain-containing protein [Flavobacteriales bacterium]